MTPQSNAAVKLTYQHYCLIPEDGQRHHIVDGKHFVTPTPSTYHQTVSRRIQFQLDAQIELAGRGQVFNAPIDVQLGLHNIVQPDIAVIAKERSQMIMPSQIMGSPDLVVEILSPSTIDIDWVKKRVVYEQHQVPEYWIVDPFEQTLTILVSKNGRYKESLHGGTISPTRFSDVIVDLKQVS